MIIREGIWKISKNTDKFEDKRYWASWSCEYEYKRTQIKFDLGLWGFKDMKLRTKEKDEHFSDCKKIDLNKTEQKLIFKSFKTRIKEKKRKLKTKTDKRSLEKMAKDNDLLDSINFKEVKNG